MVGYQGEIRQAFPGADLNSLILRSVFSKEILGKVISEKIFPLFQLLEDELKVIRETIRSMQPFHNPDFSLTHFSHYYSFYIYNLFKVIDDSVKAQYRMELQSIFDETNDDEERKKLFNICNYFLHFINWEHTLVRFYETTYEVLPSEIKYLENYLSPSLKKEIRALLALISRESFIKRQLDKKSKGLVPLINYSDWEHTVRDISLRQFNKVFGNNKSKEYITTLDEILQREFKSLY